MASKGITEATIRASLEPHVRPGEKIVVCAWGVEMRTRRFLLALLLFVCAGLLGAGLLSRGLESIGWFPSYGTGANFFLGVLLFIGSGGAAYAVVHRKLEPFRNCVVGVSDRHLTVVFLKDFPSRIEAVPAGAVRNYRLGEIPPIKIKNRGIKTVIDIRDPHDRLVIQFNRTPLSWNHDNAVKLFQLLEARQIPSASA